MTESVQRWFGMTERFLRGSVAALAVVAVLAIALLVLPPVMGGGGSEPTWDPGPPVDRRDRAPETCPVHGASLLDDTVPVSYGLPILEPAFPGDSHDRQRALFPHAAVQYENGCVLTEDSPWLARVRYCPKCRDARDEYLASGREP